MEIAAIDRLKHGVRLFNDSAANFASPAIYLQACPVQTPGELARLVRRIDEFYIRKACA